MRDFKILTGVAAPLPMVNIDTDMIIPKQFLRTIKRDGLGINLFDELRYDNDGKIKDDFILNQEIYSEASILVTGENFGCGSSREHAPWALLDFGIRCIIASSFAEIFYNNSFKNSVLPIILKEEIVSDILNIISQPQYCKITVDLEQQKVFYGEEKVATFEIDSFKRKCLLEGLDDIDLTLQMDSYILSYEAEQKQQMPWIG